jgi:hypothetical protein
MWFDSKSRSVIEMCVSVEDNSFSTCNSATCAIRPSLGMDVHNLKATSGIMYIYT